MLLYELLTGSTPFDSKELLLSGVDEMRKIIREREPIKPSTRLSQLRSGSRELEISRKHSPALHSDLDWIVMNCLEKDRSRSYDTANALAMDVQRHLANEPVNARPPSLTYKLQEAWRRNRVMLTTAALVVTALVVASALATMGMLSARRAQSSEAKLRVTADDKAEEARLSAKEASEARSETNENLYLSLVDQAHREIEANRPSVALHFLGRCPESLRGWEWHYVRNRCLSTPTPPWQLSGYASSTTFSANGVDSIALDPHGRDLADVSSNNAIVI